MTAGKRYTVTSSDSETYPYAVWDHRHRVEVTAFRWYADAVDVAQDMCDEYAADLELARDGLLIAAY